MKSYLVIFVDSEGARPTQIRDRMQNLGFEPIPGYYDFEYEWGKNATTTDALGLADQVHETLEGMKVYFKIETMD
jgi:hypothetical protein